MIDYKDIHPCNLELKAKHVAYQLVQKREELMAQIPRKPKPKPKPKPRPY